MNKQVRGLSLSKAAIKRFFDFFASSFALLAVLPIVFFAWLVASIETCSNGLFFQQRVGRDGKLFTLVKIKTMNKIEGVNTTITSSSDIRITKSGSFFRKTKIDELPQLWNVIKGEMSFVGPRPDVSGYADFLEGDDRIVLSVRPGITGPASLKYKDEESILAEQQDPEQYNDEVIWPDKVRINREYIKCYSFTKDICYIWKTIYRVIC